MYERSSVIPARERQRARAGISGRNSSRGRLPTEA
jgi:hypothetical protein